MTAFVGGLAALLRAAFPKNTVKRAAQAAGVTCAAADRWLYADRDPPTSTFLKMIDESRELKLELLERLIDDKNQELRRELLHRLGAAGYAGTEHKKTTRVVASLRGRVAGPALRSGKSAAALAYANRRAA